MKSKEKIDLIDEIYADLEELADEYLLRMINNEIYIRRRLQLLSIAFDNGIDQSDFDKARVRRYGENNE